MITVEKEIPVLNTGNLELDGKYIQDISILLDKKEIRLFVLPRFIGIWLKYCKKTKGN